MPRIVAPLLLLLLGACQSDAPAPLGSLGNPVPAGAFRGQLEYLGRLRCPDGSTPQTQGLRRHHSGARPRVEGFRVRCIYLNEEVEVFFERRPPGPVEVGPVPGFSLSEADARGSAGGRRPPGR